MPEIKVVFVEADGFLSLFLSLDLHGFRGVKLKQLLMNKNVSISIEKI